MTMVKISTSWSLYIWHEMRNGEIFDVLTKIISKLKCDLN